jgi:hypothetical protein
MFLVQMFLPRRLVFVNTCFPGDALLCEDRCQITARETMRVHSKKCPARASVTGSRADRRAFDQSERPYVPL